MIYDDSHLSGSPSAAEVLETDTDQTEHFVIEVRKMTRRSNSPRPRYVWLDVYGATKLRDELNEFLPHDPTQIILTVRPDDFELQTIEGMLTLLGRHDNDTKARILGYLTEREAASRYTLGVESQG